jgi:hypothetical protein
MWENYQPREFKSVPIPEALKKAMEEYTRQTGMRATGIFDRAIFKLMQMWDEKKYDEVENALDYNPPPESNKNIAVSFRFTGDESFQWVCDLEQEKAIVQSTRDFILRALSWYLRDKGVLEKHEPRTILKKQD